MRRFRVSIAGLLAGIALLGVSLAALVSPSPLWGNAFYSLTVATLIIAILAAIYRRDARRAFWVGFATLGWAYHLAYHGPAPLSDVGPNLVTPAIFDLIYPFTIPREAPAVVAGGTYPQPWLIPSPFTEANTTPWVTNWSPDAQGSWPGIVLLTGASGGNPTTLPVPTAWEIWTTPDRTTQMNQASPRYFQMIGHSLACLTIAGLGGLLTRWLRRTRDEPALV